MAGAGRPVVGVGGSARQQSAFSADRVLAFFLLPGSVRGRLAAGMAFQLKPRLVFVAGRIAGASGSRLFF